LRAAGIEQAAGVVAATDSDSDNLGIMLTARSLNRKVCIIVRQNHHENQLAFNAADADLIMQPSLVTARSILFLLLSPLIQPFLDYLRQHHATLLVDVIRELRETLADSPPYLWTTWITEAQAPAVAMLQAQGHVITVQDIMRDPLDRERRLACVPLALQQGGNTIMKPEYKKDLRPGDEILFCGTPYAQRVMDAALNNRYTLQYLVTGLQEPRGYLMRRLAHRRPQRDAVTLQR
jgi:hypothetical protein